MVGSKNEEIAKVKGRFDEIFNQEIEKLQKNMSSQDRNFTR